MANARFFRCLFVLLLAVPSLASAQGARPVVILFVGNSFMHGMYQPVRSYNRTAVIDENAHEPAGSPRSSGAAAPLGGIPAIFKTLTEGLGLDYEVHSELVSGKSLEFHYKNALTVIGQSKWDVVVMHDYSTGPVPAARTGNPESFGTYANLLAEAIHRANKDARVYLYETWSRADLTYPEKSPYHGESIEKMASDLHESYSREAARNGRFHGVAHVGDAWMRAIRDGVAMANPFRPDSGRINLWGADSYHPSSHGAYLNALVVVAQVTGKDPRVLGGSEKAAAALGIAPDVAGMLQRVAYDQVRSTP